MSQLLDFETEKFTRGVHAGKTLDEVASEEYSYLTFLVFKAETSEEVREYIEDWLLENQGVYRFDVE